MKRSEARATTDPVDQPRIRLEKPSEKPPDDREPAAGGRGPAGPDAGAPVVEAPVDVRSLALTILAAAAAVLLLRLADTVLIPIVLAVIISYALNPVVDGLVRLRVPRPAASALVLLALVGGLAGGGYALRSEAMTFANQLPQAATRLRLAMARRSAEKSGTVQKVQRAATELDRAAAEAATPRPAPQGVTRVQVEEPPLSVQDLLFKGSINAVELAAQIVVVLFLALYLLASGDMFRRKLVRLAGPSLSKKKITVHILEDIDRQVARFLLVRAGVSLFVAVATWLGLKAIGVEQAEIWGILAGVLNVVPYLGSAVAAAAIAVSAFMQFGTLMMALAAGAVTVAVATVEGYLVTPWATSRASQMNPVAVFVGLLFWGWLWGIWGLLLSVPLLMITKAICDRVEDLQPVGDLLGEEKKT